MSSNIYCLPTNNTQNMIFNIGVQVTILFTILSIFFILVISKVSHKAINHEFVNLIDDKLTPKINEIFKEYPELYPLTSNLLSSKIFTDEDITVKYNNKWQYITMYMTIAFLILLTVLYPLILKYMCGTCIPIKDIIILNIIIFIFIGIVEYMFFTHIAMKFIPVKPSVITVSLLNDVKKILQN
jgi:hypothetical protein